MHQYQNIFSLQGKQILITGACGYLGRSMVMGLAGLGAKVWINGRNRKAVDTLVRELSSAGHEVFPAVFDVTNDASVSEFFQKTEMPALHGVVNNAYAGTSGSIETAASESYLASYNITVAASHRILKASLPYLRKAVADCGGAAVVNVASMYGMVSPDIEAYSSKSQANPPFYGAAKAGLIQWSRYAACEFGPEAIRVNSISPGPFPSESVCSSNAPFVERLAKNVPLGRVGFANEVQGPVAFLLSDAASYVNGANLVVDGGWTCW